MAASRRRPADGARAGRARRRGASGSDERRIRTRRERVQEQALVAIESVARPLARRRVHPHIGDVVEPLPALLIEIGVIEKRPAVDEIVAQVADRTLDFALGLRAVGATRARREAPVMREAEKLEIAHERAALQPQVARDHRLHLIEEQLLRDATEIAKGVLEPVDQRPHVLARIKPAPQQPRVAEHDEQGVAHAPRKRESREVDLRLAARRRLEPDHRLGRRRRPDLAHKRFQLRITAGKARGADLRQQPHRRQLRVSGQSRFDDGFVGVEFRRHGPPRPVPHRRRVEIPIEIARSNPPVNRVPADPELASERALARALLQVVPE